MQILYVLCGIPGSGKTTLAHKLKEAYNANVHSYDDIPNSRGNLDKDGNIRKTWLTRMRKDLEEGKNVICDSTNLTPDYRTELLKEFTDICTKKVIIFVDTKPEECLLRNAGRTGVARVPDMDIRVASMIIKPPTYSEGWDEIYVYKD